MEWRRDGFTSSTDAGHGLHGQFGFEALSGTEKYMMKT